MSLIQTLFGVVVMRAMQAIVLKSTHSLIHMLAHTPLSSTILLLGILITASPVHSASTDYRAPETIEGATTVTAAEVKALKDAGTAIVDVRNPRLYARRHIPGAHHLDLNDAFNEASLAAVVARDEPVVIYSSGVQCSRTTTASRKAVSWGYEKVYYFMGGIVEWRNAGYPLEAGTR